MTRRLCEQAQGVVSGARPNLDTREAQNLEQFIIEFQDIFATKYDDCERTDRVYHRIDTGEAHVIRQSPHRLQRANQAVVDEMLKDMKERGAMA
jgi:hypothetical protein